MSLLLIAIFTNSVFVYPVFISLPSKKSAGNAALSVVRGSWCCYVFQGVKDDYIKMITLFRGHRVGVPQRYMALKIYAKYFDEYLKLRKTHRLQTWEK